MNETIQFAAAACQLGREVFMARKAAYGIEEAWNDLTPAIRHIYIRHAAEMLKAHAPAVVSKVAGSISPA